MDADREEMLDELYAAPLGEFVSRRDELARTLRRDGDRDAAADVKALRKPSVAAWAVNQLARRERKRLDAFLAAGEGLRAAHRGVLGGNVKPGALDKATAAERHALGELVDAAKAILEQAAGAASEPTLERVRATLHAAAVDETIAARVREGCLMRDAEPPAFPFAEVAGAGHERAPQARSRRGDAKAEARLRAAREKHAAAGACLHEARRSVAEAEEEAHERRRALDRAEHALERAECAVAERRADLERADRDAERARATLDRLA